jgi:hypothetical protein
VVLLLPADIEKLALQACAGDEGNASALVRLVLAHELSHVKTGDLGLLPLIWVLRVALLPILLCLWCTFVASRWLWEDPLLTTILQPFLPYATLGGLIAYLVLKSALRDRENLADAVASLYVTPDVLPRLTLADSDSRHGVSPLERFILALNIPLASARSYVGFSAGTRRLATPFFAFIRALMRRARTPLALFRSAVQRRLMALASKRYAIPTELLPSPGLIVSAGALLGALFYAFQLLFFDAFMWLWFASAPNTREQPMDSFLHAIDIWAQAVVHTDVYRAYELVYATTLAVLASVFGMWHFRDAPARARAVTSGNVAALAACLFAILLTGALTAALLASWCRPPFLLFPGVKLSFSKVEALFVLTSPLLFMLITGLAHRWREVDRRMAILVGFSLPLYILVPLILVPVTAPVLSPMGAFLLTWNGILFVAGLWSLGVFRPLWFQDALAREWFTFRRFLWFRRIRPTWRAGPQPSLLDDVEEAAASCVVSYLLPLAIVLSLALPQLQALDTWYFDNLGKLRELLHQLGDLAPEQLHALPRTAVLRYVGLSLFVNHAGPDAVTPSTLLCFVTLVTQLPVWAFAFGIRELWSRSSRRISRSARETPMLCGLASSLDSSPLKQIAQRRLRSLLARCRSAEGPVIGPGTVPLMRTTCEAMMMVPGLLGADQLTYRKFQWVRECECKEGGFAPLPGGNPDILHTYYALRVAQTLKRQEEVLLSVHRRWIEGQIRDHLEWPGLFADRVWLEDIHCLAGALSSATGSEGIPVGLRATLVAEAVRRWRSENYSPVSTYYLTAIFSALQYSCQEAVEEIRTVWLPSWEPRLRTLNPESDLETAWHVVETAKAVHPDGMRSVAGIQQLEDNLVKALFGQTRRRSLVRWLLDIALARWRW